GNVLIRIRGRQIELRIRQPGVQVARLLEILDSQVVLAILISFHASIELIPRAKLAAARNRANRGDRGRYEEPMSMIALHPALLVNVKAAFTPVFRRLAPAAERASR